MSLEELWPKLEVNTPTSVNIPFYVSKIEAYLADPVSCRTWKIKLARKGWKMEYIFLHDLIMYTAEGKQIRMLEHPSLLIVQNGTLQEGNIIIATSIIKIKMPAYDAELFYIVLKDWISHPNPTQVEKIYRGIHSLPGYVPSTRLLGSYTGTLLCPWTNSTILDNPTINISRYYSPKSIPGNFELRNFNSSYHNLKKLDEVWTGLTTPWPLILRVFAKSKSRIFIRQEDQRKPILCMRTVLAGDLTGFCKILVWDDAVLSFAALNEGDILVLGGKYKIGKYQKKKIDPYILEPKARSGLSPVSIEIKLNSNDLNNVCILDHASNMPVPPALWNFKSVQQIISGQSSSSRLVDFTGVIIYHGRWERDRCCNEMKQHTGQFWIRVWLKVCDHTSLTGEITDRERSKVDAENEDEQIREDKDEDEQIREDEDEDKDEERSVSIKMYIERERMASMKALIPGYPCVISNLKVIQIENQFSHLECTNETQIFPGDAGFSSRFISPLDTAAVSNRAQIEASNSVVEMFRTSWQSNMAFWGEKILKFGCFGGNEHPPRSVSVSFNIVGFVLRDAEAVKSAIINLPFKTCVRVMIGGSVSCIRTMSMNGSLADQIQEEEIIDIPEGDEAEYSARDVLDYVLSKVPEVQGESKQVPEPIPEHIPKPVHVPELEFCSSIPSQHSFLRSISGLTLSEIRETVSETCFLDHNSAESVSSRSGSIIPSRFCMVQLIVRGCKLWCQASIQLKEQLIETRGRNCRYCVDLFRFQGTKGPHSSSGVESVLRLILPNHEPDQSSARGGIQQHDEEDIAGNDTLDFLAPFNNK